MAVADSVLKRYGTAGGKESSNKEESENEDGLKKWMSWSAGVNYGISSANTAIPDEEHYPQQPQEDAEEIEAAVPIFRPKSARPHRSSQTHSNIHLPEISEENEFN